MHFRMQSEESRRDLDHNNNNNQSRKKKKTFGLLPGGYFFFSDWMQSTEIIKMYKKILQK